jgi:nuclear GTP-binding protein
VLKGVVRVEALPNASDHVQAVLDRVKPVYLSRTYGTPVPSEGVFEAETFLDQLARKRGRLLKGGEPDLESVAKIVLSDWVRGRIPFFVPPPERPEGLDAESSKKESSKKGLVVQQKLGGIVPSNKYVAEDTAIAQENQSQSEEDANEEEGSESETGAEDDELKWTDVFPTGARPYAYQIIFVEHLSDAENVPAPDADDESAVQDEAQGDSESSKAEKDKRMKTNKVGFRTSGSAAFI